MKTKISFILMSLIAMVLFANNPVDIDTTELNSPNIDSIYKDIVFSYEDINEGEVFFTQFDSNGTAVAYFILDESKVEKLYTGACKVNNANDTEATAVYKVPRKKHRVILTLKKKCWNS